MRHQAPASLFYYCMEGLGLSKISLCRLRNSRNISRYSPSNGLGTGIPPDNADPFSFAAMSAHTIDFIEALKLGATNLVGWSDGAITALLVAISRPDLVKRLVSVSGLFHTNAQSREDLNWIRSLTPESFRKSMAALVRRYDEVSPDGPHHFPVVFEKTKRLWLNEPNIARKSWQRLVLLRW